MLLDIILYQTVNIHFFKDTFKYLIVNVYFIVTVVKISPIQREKINTYITI